MLLYADPDATGRMNYQQFEVLMENMKRKQLEENDADALGAFVSLGGPEDGSEHI